MRILYIEPFNAGSHAGFTRVLTEFIDADWTLLTLSGRHWKWRMRSSALYFAERCVKELERPYDLVFASSFFPLADLKALVPRIASVPSICYFHENQLAYPARSDNEDLRDLHFGFTQIVSAASATRCVFNSAYNLRTFLDLARNLFSRMPDARPRAVLEEIELKSSVLGVPMDLDPLVGPTISDTVPGPDRKAGPVILWNHRWEHDKNPELFLDCLQRLARSEVPFRLLLLGERFHRAPSVFEKSRDLMGRRVLRWGGVEDRSEYEALLETAHIVVSTALHEFFGTALMEAVHSGARPLVPDSLVYPELYPPEYRYKTDEELVEELCRMCIAWTRGELDLRRDRTELTLPFSAGRLIPRYEDLMESVSNRDRSGTKKGFGRQK